MTRVFVAVLATTLLGAVGSATLAASPAAAQSSIAAPGAQRSDPFASLSPEGQRVMRDALRGDKETNRVDRDKVRAARDRMLDVVAADVLDVTALRRAMDDERKAVGMLKARQQTSLSSALQMLTLADRRAFAADARAVRGRIEGRLNDRGPRGENLPPM